MSESEEPDPSLVEPEPSVVEPVESHDETGLELARDITRATTASSGAVPVRKRRTSQGGAPQVGDRRVPRNRISGAYPDERDPQMLESMMDRLVSDHGWDLDLRVHGIFGRWTELVGTEVGDHSTPETFDGGRLVVRTDSTAWATQLKLLAPQVLKRLNAELGHGTVTLLEVLGPHGPSWKKGRLSVRDGRGPRDTYG